MGRTRVDRPPARRIVFVLACVTCLLAISAPVFAASVDISVSLDENLVYCNATYEGNIERISQALNDGTEVSLIWNIDVQGVRTYWLNENIGGVVVKHSVVPDLVSRNWRLIDRTSGISRLTHSLEDAIAFLTHLKHFPVIDRSLLEKGRQYRLSLTLEEHLGTGDDRWFTRWWGYEKTDASLDFTNP